MLSGRGRRQRGAARAAVDGQAISEELAARAKLDERYVREWLGAMTTGGIFLYEAASGRYRLPHEHATHRRHGAERLADERRAAAERAIDVPAPYSAAQSKIAVELLLHPDVHVNVSRIH